MSLQRLHPRLKDFVVNKWERLTAIQERAFLPIFNGLSCTIEAPTAGGKTEAVLFPLLTRIASNKSVGFKVLYIAPLKALLNDLTLRVKPYAQMCFLEAFKWHGDVSQKDKVQEFLFPSDILLTTPESLEAILLRKSGWMEVFKNLETIVIDEAHYFALTERGSHLISLLERIEAGIGIKAQRIAVTATVGNPERLLLWLTGNRNVGVNITDETVGDKERDFKVQFFTEEGKNLKTELYRLLLQKKSIVFERSRSGTEDTATWINQMNDMVRPPFPIVVKTHHSSVSKRLREDAEKSIKIRSESSVNAIISTSTLELGIDIGDLDRVIQIGGLNSSSSFLQRVGRTGRRSGRPQYFRGLCDDPDELVLLVACVSLGLRRISEKILFPTKAFHILAHQTICICLQKGGSTIKDIWTILSNAFCFSGITEDEFEYLIEFMIEQDFLRVGSDGLLLTSDKTEDLFLRANWKRLFSIFDTGPMYNVVDGKKVIGTLDSEFARAQKLPFVFVLGGIEWNAKGINHEAQQVSVERNNTGLAPKWKAIADFDIPVEIAHEIGRLLMNDDPIDFLDTPASIVFHSQRQVYKNLEWNKNKWVLDMSSLDGNIYLWTFAGEKINRCIAALISNVLISDSHSDYKHVVIEQNKDRHISIEDIVQQLKNLINKDQHDVTAIITQSIKPKWFSKFSVCVPDKLAKATLLDKGYDVEGFVFLLKSVKLLTKVAE